MSPHLLDAPKTILDVENDDCKSAKGQFRRNPAPRGLSNMPLFATEIADIGAEHFLLCPPPVPLDVNLLRNGNSVVHLDAEVPYRALDLTMTE
jgi:hypothetical protein